MSIEKKLNFSGRPVSQGLYDPNNEHDSCGIGFVANINGKKTHDIIKDGLEILENLTHRGAVGADPTMGDGAGLLMQLPDSFLRKECEDRHIRLPKYGLYAVAQVFFPYDKGLRLYCESLFEKIVKKNKQIFLGWRDVPVNKNAISKTANNSSPKIKQCFVSVGKAIQNQDEFERKIFVIRKQLSNLYRKDTKIAQANASVYISSFSSRILNYKGMLLADSLGGYYQDLNDKRVCSALALVHQRFSTNTFPSWDLAQPFRLICHNGEINTLRGNINWMEARKGIMSSDLFGKDLKTIWPVISDGQSDSASFDNALELLIMGGYSLSHAMMLLIPEAWQNKNSHINKNIEAFYEYYSGLMEPWDGPAAVAFTDGRQIGATLDRNGLRPARYFITDDGKIILSSEMGVLPYPEKKIIKKWRLQPGRMLLIDLDKGKIINDNDIKIQLANKYPYKKLLKKGEIKIESLLKHNKNKNKTIDKLNLQQAFGYTQEDLKLLISPMVANSQEAIGSMGTDTPISVLSSNNKLLYTYFKQNFAQVTNPAIDPIRENLVMSLKTILGPRMNLLSLIPVEHKRLILEQPIINNNEIEAIKNIHKYKNSGHKTVVLDSTSELKKAEKGMLDALKKLQVDSEKAIKKGANILLISDKNISKKRISIPSLLSLSVVHQHLVKRGLRTKVGIALETGEAREVHHFCVLAGYGADAINPYLAFETLKDLIGEISSSISYKDAEKRYISAIGKGILKVMSKMGISTYQSYNGAQIFDAVGLSTKLINKYFPGTASKIEGINIRDVLKETLARHIKAYGQDFVLKNMLEVGGEYAFRLRGEDHVWTPETVSDLQHAVRGNFPKKYKTFSKTVNYQSKQILNPRGLFELVENKHKISLEKIEPAADIVKRFATGAMSFGSISREAHTNLALAMNKIGGKSNTGEGGEEVDRFKIMPDGTSMRSAIKQVASGRFGVTTEYLVNADDIQIKIAQGAKPGEGGQLPGHKVDSTIAKVRYSTPGVGLISPPPHHDIYSIEDLAQLIFDLKNVNSNARISVKLVSEVGVGTVAAGVAKARADHVTISGFEGGTGASPLTSIKHAGSPWELGLAETQQTLVMNGLRGRIAVQVDGGLRTGRDVIIGALLGADEFGFSTAPLIASGCLMMRKCHLNTCPVGIATQDRELRKKFTGTPEHVINYFFFVAEEVRNIMASLGFTKFNQLIGRTDKLDMKKALDHWKTKGLDFSKLFYRPKVSSNVAFYNCEKQAHPIDDIIDRKLIKVVKKILRNKVNETLKINIKNTDRTVGAMLSGYIAKKKGHSGLNIDSLKVEFKGTAGQSFGAFLSKGVTFDLAGEANDYVGKGLSGGKIIVKPSNDSAIIPEESMIIGNTVLYGAISGECYFRGIAGERFCVRNSGAIAIVEGVGDHGCEYMTGGIVVCLGKIGRNFAAGMSGGIAYIYNPEKDFESLLNQEMVEIENVRFQKKNNRKNLRGLSEINKNMLINDEYRLKYLLRKHVLYTNSLNARQILENWQELYKNFVKITPLDYRRALLEKSKNNFIKASVA